MASQTAARVSVTPSTHRCPHVFDHNILGLSNSFLWGCSRQSALLPFFFQHLGAHSHLDVGVGSGFYLVQAVPLLERNETKLTLMDPHLSSLDAVQTHIHMAGFLGDIELITHDIQLPMPGNIRNAPFDSISLFHLFHSLPGGLARNASTVFSHLIPLLQQDGTVYGAALLGKGVKHTFIGRILLRFWRWKGLMDVCEDDAEGLASALGEHFEHVNVRIEGSVALFVGRGPLNPSLTSTSK